MTLTRDEVRQLADLARLDLSEEELAMAEQDLDKILGYVDRLKKVETEGVEPFTMPARTEWRPDVELPCDYAAREIILSNFPERVGDLLKTPGVFDKPKGGKA
jgi:aspartyl-tRNA(Asn)/glutamyl-tRNA(Gln) amidotransferase subunit C